MNQQDVGVAVVGSDHGLLWINDAFSDLVGYSAEELIGRTFEEITHPDDVDLDRTLAKRLFAGELDHYEMEKRYICRDESVVPIHLRVSVMRDRRGQIVCGTATVERISSDAKLGVTCSLPLTPEEREMDRIRRALMEW